MNHDAFSNEVPIESSIIGQEMLNSLIFFFLIYFIKFAFPPPQHKERRTYYRGTPPSRKRQTKDNKHKYPDRLSCPSILQSSSCTSESISPSNINRIITSIICAKQAGHKLYQQ